MALFGGSKQQVQIKTTSNAMRSFTLKFQKVADAYDARMRVAESAMAATRSATRPHAPEAERQLAREMEDFFARMSQLVATERDFNRKYL